MARLTPAELNAAKKARQEEAEMAARKREDEREALEQQKSRSEQLSSALKALYDEMDKLNRKSPAMNISELSLGRVNKTIRSVKELLAEAQDDFVDEIAEFVPAGDMPEYRDVVLVLSQLKAGLERYQSKRRASWRALDQFSY